MQTQYIDYFEKNRTFNQIDWAKIDEEPEEVSVIYSKSTKLNNKIEKIVKKFQKNPNKFPKLEDEVWR